MVDQLILKLREQVIAALEAGPAPEEQMALIGHKLDQLNELMAELKAENATLRERKYGAFQEGPGSMPERDLVKNHLLLSARRAYDRHSLRVNCPVCHRQTSSMEGILNYSCGGCGWVADFSREDLETARKEFF